MGSVTFEPDRIPVRRVAFRSRRRSSTARHTTATRPESATRISCFVDDPTAVPVTEHGPRIEHDPRFPRRINVEFVAVTGPTRSRCAYGNGAPGRRSRAGPARARRPRSRTGAGSWASTCAWTCSAATSRSRSASRPSGRTGRPRVRRRDRRRVGMPGPRRDAVGRRRAHQTAQRRRLTATEVDLERLRATRVARGRRHGTRRRRTPKRPSTSWRCSPTRRGPSRSSRSCSAAHSPDPATYVGKGKADELRDLVDALDIDVVIIDDELTPAQQRNLETLFNVDVVDRVALILDIFAQHATQPGGCGAGRARATSLPAAAPAGPRYSSSASRALASAPAARVRRSSRSIGGGCCAGSSGSNATCADLGATRATQRKARRAATCRTVALVGYTNAGKSTLLNRLTDAGVLVENQLFSTLDPTTRRLHLPGRRDRVAVRHGRIRPPAAAPARRCVPLHARRGGRRRSARCTSST